MISGLSAVPQDNEVKVALQSLLVASAATTASSHLSDIPSFETAQFVSDATFSQFSLTMDKADIGYLRRVVLESPPPAAPRQMGFLEALFTSVIRVIPDYNKMVAYLRPQALMEGEVILTGTMDAIRLAAPYPFRYEGSGSVIVAGSRITEPFTLTFSFIIPLEGPAASSIIPIEIRADGEDFLSVAQSLFPVPTGVDITEQLKLVL